MRVMQIERDLFIPYLCVPENLHTAELLRLSTKAEKYPQHLPLCLSHKYKMSLLHTFLALTLLHTHLNSILLNIIRFFLYEYRDNIPLAFKLPMLETRETIIVNAYYNLTQHQKASRTQACYKENMLMNKLCTQ